MVPLDEAFHRYDQHAEAVYIRGLDERHTIRFEFAGRYSALNAYVTPHPNASVLVGLSELATSPSLNTASL